MNENEQVPNEPNESPERLRLFHTTDRENVPSIVENGWRNGEDGYVCLCDDIWSWHQNWVMSIDGILGLGRREVVFIFDFPKSSVDKYMVEAIYAPLEDYGPEEMDEDSIPGTIAWREWHIPAELVNLHFLGIAFWTGDCPVTGEDLRELWERRLSP